MHVHTVSDAILSKAAMELSTAKRVVRAKLPYFTKMMESLAPLPIPGMGTMGVTEHLVLMYDPEVLLSWPLRKSSFVTAHEGMHVFEKTCERQKRLGISPGTDDATLFNIAADCAINRVLKTVWGGWAPDDAVLPECIAAEVDKNGKKTVLLALPREMHNATTEEIYFWLKKQVPPPPPSGGKGKKKGGKGGKDPSKGGGGQGQGQDGEGEDGQLGGALGKVGTGKGNACRGHCGTGGGHELPNEPGPEHPASRSDGDKAQVIRATAQAIEDAVRNKNQGFVPEELARTARKTLEAPEVAWEQELQREVRSAYGRQKGAVDFGWHGLSKRQWAIGVGPDRPILPKLFAPIVLVDLVVDTSGSMGERELSTIMREGAGAIRAAGGTVMFVSIDAAIHAQKNVRSIDEARKLLKGGGGTDFRPYFESLKKRAKSKRPRVIIYATDGYGTAPAVPPQNATTIWLLIGENAPRPNVPGGGECKWGRVVRVKKFAKVVG